MPAEQDMEKVIITAVNKELMRRILAHRADIEKTFEGENPYLLLVNYSDFLASDEEKKKNKKKSYVTITPDVKYMLARVLTRMITETKNISAERLARIEDARVTDDERRLIEAQCVREYERTEKARELLEAKQMNTLAGESASANDVCVTKFVCDVINRVSVSHTGTLAIAKDPTCYFAKKVLIMLEMGDGAVRSTVTNLFNQFLTRVAKIVGSYIWEDHKTVNRKLLRSALRMHDCNDEIFHELESAIPPPTQSKKRTPKKSEEGEAANAEGAATADGTTAVASATVEAK